MTKKFIRVVDIYYVNVLIFGTRRLEPLHAFHLLLLLFCQANRSTNTSVVLQDLDAFSAGLFRCEVLADAPRFQTASAEASMFIGGEFGPNFLPLDWHSHVNWILTKPLLHRVSNNVLSPLGQNFQFELFTDERQDHKPIVCSKGTLNNRTPFLKCSFCPMYLVNWNIYWVFWKALRGFSVLDFETI